MKSWKKALIGVACAATVGGSYLLLKPGASIPNKKPASVIQNNHQGNPAHLKQPSEPKKEPVLQEQPVWSPYQTLEGIVLQNDHGIKDAEVVVAPAYYLGETEDSFHARTRTSSDGSFTTKLFPGLYDVIAMSQQSSFAILRNINVPGPRITLNLEDLLSLELKTDAPEPRLSLLKRDPPTDILVRNLEPRKDCECYRFVGLPDGAYFVDLIIGDESHLFTFTSIKDYPLERKAFGEGRSTIDVKVRGVLTRIEQMRLSGTVIDEDTKEKIAGASVIVTNLADDALTRSVTTDATGTFISAMPPARQKVEVSAQNYLPATEYVDSDATSMAIALKRGASLHGRLVNRKEEPLPNRTLRLLDIFGSELQEGSQIVSQTSASGEFVFSGYQQQGLEAVLLVESGGRLFRKRMNLAQDDKHKYSAGDVTLEEELHSIRGTILGGSSIVAGAQALLRLYDASPLLQAQAQYAAVSDKNGNFEFVDMPSEKYTLIVLAKGFPEHREQVDLERDVSLAVRIVPGCTVKGVVLDSNGFALGNTPIVFQSEKSRVSVRSDQNGIYEVPLNAGKYQYLAYSHPFEKSGVIEVASDTDFNIAFNQTRSYCALVLDRETNQPLQCFTVAYQYRSADDKENHHRYRQKKLFDLTGMLSLPIPGEFTALSVDAPGYKNSGPLSFDLEKERQPDILLEKIK